MQGRPKLRGRPRKYDVGLVSDTQYDHELITSRGAQNVINYAYSLAKICDECTVETQKYFLGGLTGVEVRAGVRKKHKIKKYVMEELGRHSADEIAEIAEAISSDRAFDTWTQQEIVNFLKGIRLGRNQDSSQ